MAVRRDDFADLIIALLQLALLILMVLGALTVCLAAKVVNYFALPPPLLCFFFGYCENRRAYEERVQKKNKKKAEGFSWKKKPKTNSLHHVHNKDSDKGINYDGKAKGYFKDERGRKVLAIIAETLPKYLKYNEEKSFEEKPVLEEAFAEGSHVGKEKLILMMPGLTQKPIKSIKGAKRQIENVGSSERNEMDEDGEEDAHFLHEIESKFGVDGLKESLRAEHKALSALYAELDEERNAATIAANEAMSMISRLQEEKAALKMEALHYQRMAEEKARHDEETVALLRDILFIRETEKLDLEKEVEVYRGQMLLMSKAQARLAYSGPKLYLNGVQEDGNVIMPLEETQNEGYQGSNSLDVKMNQSANLGVERYQGFNSLDAKMDQRANSGVLERYQGFDSLDVKMNQSPTSGVFERYQCFNSLNVKMVQRANSGVFRVLEEEEDALSVQPNKRLRSSALKDDGWLSSLTMEEIIRGSNKVDSNVGNPDGGCDSPCITYDK